MLLSISACRVPGSGPSAWLAGGNADGWHRICMPTAGVRRYTVGFDVAPVQGTGTVTIRDVRLSNAAGARVGTIDVIPLTHSDRFAAFGMWGGYPPRMSDNRYGLRSAWAQRIPARGATLAPNRRGYNFIVGLAVPARGDSTPWLGPLVIDYADADGHTGTWTSNYTYLLAGHCTSKAVRG